MKKIKNLLVVVAFTFIAISLNAQTEAGKILVGGSSEISFGSMTQKYKSDDGDGTAGKGIELSLSPEAGYFVMDGLAVGLSFDVSMSTFKQDGTEVKETNTILMFAPFAKYYYGTGNIKPFAEGAIGLGSAGYKVSDGNDSQTEKSGIFGFNFELGAAMFLNENVAFEAGIGYQSISSKDKEDNENNLRRISGGIAVSFGVIVTL